MYHPNILFVHHIIDGMRNGFCIGFNGPREDLIASNLLSSRSYPNIISTHLNKECSHGHTIGPYPSPPCSPFRSAGVGLVPKKSGGHRIIVHLSVPDGASINDSISTGQYSLHYIGVDNVVAHLSRHGTGALLFKIDIQHAFRNVPVHPEDWCMLGMKWNDQYYIDKVLPFSLRSSPAIFNLLANTVCWILRENYGLKSLEFYQDNFIGVGPAPSSNPQTSTAAI